MRRNHLLVLLALLGVCFSALEASAQRSRRGQSSAAVQDETLTTKDGVQLAVSYYPSSAGDQAAPVVMLHDRTESRAVFDNFARRLQKPAAGDQHDSFAVLTVDLRGHGDSTVQSIGPAGSTARPLRGQAGNTRQLEADKLRKQDFVAMVLGDMEAVRKFLVTENDAGRLNLNRMSVIGVGLGAVVGVNYTARDWSAPPLATVKQGQDVKAMILVSPRWSIQGLSIKNAVRQPGVRQEVATMLMFGAEGRRFAADANKIYKQLERYHDTESSDPETTASLVRIGAKSELQGTQLLKQAGSRAEDLMIRFLVDHTVDPDLDRIKRRDQ